MHVRACNDAGVRSKSSKDTVAGRQLVKLLKHLTSPAGKDLSLAEVGRRVGRGGEFIGRLLSSESGPSPDTIERIAKAFGYDLSWFASDLDVEVRAEPGEPLPQVSAYLAELEADGRAAHPDDARELLAIRVPVGAHLLTRSAVRLMHDEASARRRAEKPAPLSKGKAAMEGFVLPAEVQAKRRVK